jgi:phosphoesterase RecJ-like protein
VDEFFGNVEYSATGEILYDFIEKTKIVEIDYSIAMPLYAAIMTDTGSFRFDRTAPRIHRIVARLLGKGVDPSFVYSSIFEKGNFSRIKLLGRALNSMTLDSSEKISFMILKREDLKETGAVDADVEGFVNFCLTINNVQIGLLFYELKDGVKISFRSKGDIPVNELAAEFGGGGHLNAAGTRLFNVDLNEYIEKVVFAAQKFIEE